MSKALIVLLSVLVAETAYFGWHTVPQSNMEMAVSGFTVLIIALFIILGEDNK